MLGFSLFREILSISSMYTIPFVHRSTSYSATWSKLRMMFSTSSPTYPASVSVVASTIVKGTSRIRASVCARSVLPEPVGPTRRMLDFCSSTSLAVTCVSIRL
jgi:hypothetical protein